MNKKLKFILLSAILMGGGAIFLCPDYSNSADAPKFSIMPPRQALDLSDLDARDSLNRPVKSLAARKNLENLFVRSLNDLLMFNLTPARRNFLIMMEQTWNHLFGWLSRRFLEAGSGLYSWLRNEKNKFKNGLVSFNELHLNCPKGVRLEENARTSFQFLVSFILSSTYLLR